MNYLLRNLRFTVSEHYDLDREIGRKLDLPLSAFRLQQVLRKAVDFRRKDHPVYDFSVLLDLPSKHVKNQDLSEYSVPEVPAINRRTLNDPNPIIIGMGPAGLFCALALVEQGFQPWIFEQGDRMDQRANAVEDFWSKGLLDPQSNVQYGEGGAGAFSDGKLTSRGRDHFVGQVYELMIKFGAHPEISYEALPHLGTDGIRALVLRIRNYLLEQGCQIFYRHKLEAISHKSGNKIELTINGARYSSQCVILALGNAARSTFEMMQKAGLPIEQKNYAVGFRLEHPQSYINQAIHGSDRWEKLLGAASYRLVDRSSGVYSFCMCPGGEVIPASSEQSTIVTNGMSFASRAAQFGNSAIVTGVDSSVFGAGALDGIKFQEMIEKACFRPGYKAPAQTAHSFVHSSGSQLSSQTSYRLGVVDTPLERVYPTKISGLIKKALQNFNRVYAGFSQNGILIAPETRTSCPIRMKRDPMNLNLLGYPGIFACGEGSGYAGGIVSSAADGYKLGKGFELKKDKF
jgi:uncharacterized FAD-dependent dehydrogenase